MAIDRNLVIVVGIAGVVLVVASMSEKTREETPGREGDDELRDGKRELHDLEQRYDSLNAEGGGDWKLETVKAMQGQLFELVHRMKKVWQLRAAQDVNYEITEDPEAVDFQDREGKLAHALDALATEFRGAPAVINQHNSYNIQTTYAKQGDRRVNFVQLRDERSVSVNVEMSPAEFNSLGTEGARRHDLQDNLRLGESVNPASKPENGAFMALTNTPNAASQDNDESAAAVDDKGKNLPSAPSNVIPPLRGGRQVSTFNNARKQDTPPTAPVRKPTVAPPISRENQLARAEGAVGERPNFNTTNEGTTENSALIEARIDSLRKQLEESREKLDKASVLQLEGQIEDLTRQIPVSKAPGLVEWGKKIFQLQKSIAGYQKTKHNAARQARVETLFESLMDCAPDRQTGFVVDKNVRQQWDSVYAVTKSDRDSIFRDWGVKVRTAEEAGFAAIPIAPPPAKRVKKKPTVVTIPEGTETPSFMTATPLPATPTKMKPSPLDEPLGAGRKRSASFAGVKDKSQEVPKRPGDSKRLLRV